MRLVEIAVAVSSVSAWAVLKWVAVAYLLLVLLAVVTGADAPVIAALVPVALVQAAIGRLRRDPEYRVRQALRRLRPEFARLSPPIREWYVVSAGGPSPAWIAVYVACAREADRPALEPQLPAVSARLGDELRRGGAPEAVVAGLRLIPASSEAVDREGGFWAYAHNH